MIYKNHLENFRNKSGEKFSKIIDEVVVSTLAKSNRNDVSKHVDISVVDEILTAESTKIYNILKIKQDKLIELLLQAGLLYTIGEVVSFVLSMLLFISMVAQTTKIQLREREARILYCIYKMGSNFSYDRIQNKYLELFHVQLKDIELERSIGFLEKLKVLKILNDSEVELVEEINVTYE
jgi:hypothetical protein